MCMGEKKHHIRPYPKQTIPSPAAATTSLAKAVAVIGIVAPVPTLVTPIVGVKLPSARAPTALPGEACWHFNTNTGTTKNPDKKTQGELGECKDSFNSCNDLNAGKKIYTRLQYLTICLLLDNTHTHAQIFPVLNIPVDGIRKLRSSG